ncbi:enoyl-CoA hydratase/isomerase family protein [Stenotrophomonas sp. Iso1]|uniref:enoyl-CoA hydratase/isomerase family protein n=1 Tax=Stenotrophomonas sp. Iso1 TaxID=2977283 RepID=UPI0022B7731A|nr:enoyl-CoA hydratase/isomerase family protein [Stenotrophomonas sp. Iso1]
MTTDNAVISWSRDGAVARIGIHRPDKRNALATRHWAAIETALDAIATSDAQIVVLTGVPGAFSAGADIDELGQLLTAPDAFAANNAQVQRTQLKLQRLPQTTLAVIDGACVGGGLGLALACDLRLSSARSRFAITPAKLGLVYSADDSRRLVNTVGMARAREMLLTGRLLDAATARDWGLVNQLADADGLEALEQTHVQQLLATSGQARRAIKTVLGHLGGDASLSAAQADAAFNDAFSSRDFVEGAAAFLEKRAPRFS